MMSRFIYSILAFILVMSVKIGYFFATMLLIMWEFFHNILLKLLSWARVRLFIRIIEDEPDKGIGHLQFEVDPL